MPDPVRPVAPREDELESFRDQLSRVEQMANDENCETWDLSDNDQAALKAVLADRQRMAAKLNALLAVSPVPCAAAPVDEVERLRAAIRAHRDARGDDRCWLDDEALYAILPEGYTPPARDTAVELERCRQFIASRQNPATVYVSPEREIERLQACLEQRLTPPAGEGARHERNESTTEAGHRPIEQHDGASTGRIEGDSGNAQQGHQLRAEAGQVAVSLDPHRLLEWVEREIDKPGYSLLRAMQAQRGVAGQRIIVEELRDLILARLRGEAVRVTPAE